MTLTTGPAMLDPAQLTETIASLLREHRHTLPTDVTAALTVCQQTLQTRPAHDLTRLHQRAFTLMRAGVPPTEVVTSLVSLLAETISTDAIYCCRYLPDVSIGLVAGRRAGQPITQPPFEALPPAWLERLRRQRMIFGTGEQFSPLERAVIPRNAMIVLVPITVGRNLWGFLYLVDYDRVRWSYQLLTELTTVTDIMAICLERDDLQRRVRRFEDQLDRVVNDVHDGMWDWDIERNELVFSWGWKRKLGYDDAELPDSFDTFEHLLHPDDAQRVVQDMLAFLDGSDALYVNEYRMQHKLGSYRWLAARAFIIRDVHGTARRMIGTHSDISLMRQREKSERYNREMLQTLYETYRVLNVALDRTQILDLALTQSTKVIPHDAASLIEIDGDQARLTSYQMPLFGGVLQRVADATCASVHALSLCQPIITDQQPSIAPAVSVLDELSQVMPEQVTNTLAAYALETCSYIGAPIFLGDEVIAILNLISGHEGLYTEEHLERLHEFAQQASFALHKAQLQEQARSGAMIAERQRIAAELHDAVTQTLLSAKMIAEILPRIWAKDQALGQHYLDELQHITRSALDEMRTVLIELRPETLLRDSLDVLLKQLCNANRQRIQGTIECRLVGDPGPLPDDVQVAFYRIAQEALHNIVKHAEATHVLIELTWTPLQVGLQIIDDGRGFDYLAHETDVGHFGLTIMKQRAADIGAYLTIRSQMNVGTELRLTCFRKR